MKPEERLLHYVTYETTSSEAGGSPSSEGQTVFAKALAEEMREMGIDTRVYPGSWVCGIIPATPGCEDKVHLGFLSHLDTSPEASGKNVRPQIIENYQGGEVSLGRSGLILSPSQFPDLNGLAGRTLITTSGDTLLGADDKSGIAEILTMAERLLKSNIPHGQISLAFTPDEEIGSGASMLDLQVFDADYAYTVDGGAENEISFETFNAAEARFEIHGTNVHTGSAKGIMKNAAKIACQIVSMLPAADAPETTEGREGFFHLEEIKGNVNSASLLFLIRDHDAGGFAARQACLRQIEKVLNERYGEGTVFLTIHQQYKNMAEKIKPCMHLVENAADIMRQHGLTPDFSATRGGTDGAQLSFRGLPCPNLGTGGYAFHGPYEHITAEAMESVTEMLLDLVKKYAEMPRP